MSVEDIKKHQNNIKKHQKTAIIEEEATRSLTFLAIQ